MNKEMLTVILLAATAVLSGGAQAADGKQKLECINLMSVDSSPVINDRTILVKMKAGDVHYKRIDLAGPCTGIEYKGFGHRTGYNELCTSDTVTPLVTGGGVCKIDRIVNISDGEAKQLMAQRK